MAAAKRGRPKGSKNKRRRRNRVTIPVNGIVATDSTNTGNDAVLGGFQAQRTKLQGELLAMQGKLSSLDAAEKAYIESMGGNTAAMGIPTDILLTSKGTVDQRSERGRIFLAQHPEYVGKVIQH